ncbi:MAG TPA: hypothetical protein VMH05_12175 [Bryobacteraceae bacterium]|nr:hypothetical protein [Bryobacteraceae bacterium]
MQPRLCLFAAYVCTAALLAAQSTGGDPQSTGGSPQSTGGSSQSTSSSSQSTGTSSSTDQGQRVYVRRLAIGATLSVLGLSPVKGSSSSTTTNVNAATTVETDLSSSGASSRIGYGLTAQAAITEHFAVAVGGFLRRLGYIESNTQTTTVTTFINAVPQTTTTTTSTRVDARARVVDVPITLRWYGKGRHERGGRWFVEGGGAWRDVENFKSSLSAIDASGNATCCTFGTAQPTHHQARGVVAGVGAQFIDPFGIRVIPEVRYIRWLTPTFDDSTTHTQRNQVEAELTLSF